MATQRLPKLMAMNDVMDCLGGLSRQRVHELIRKKDIQFEVTSAGRIFLASDILKLKKEMAKHPRSKAGKK
ncbi:hypothetical protein H6770_05670 [Candidatus Peribacteria bacterium]|nr:hypothetical protein [Candidatus Peribacteria bacterium]